MGLIWPCKYKVPSYGSESSRDNKLAFLIRVYAGISIVYVDSPFCLYCQAYEEGLAKVMLN